MCNYPLFASKQTFARIDFLRQGEQLVDKKGTHSVKFLAVKLTIFGKWTSGQVNEWTRGQVDEWRGGEVNEWTS